MSEVAKVFETLSKMYQKANVKTPRTYYFSLGEDEKWTVVLGKDKCEVKPGKPAADADCFFKASTEMFIAIMRLRLLHSPLHFIVTVYDRTIGRFVHQQP